MINLTYLFIIPLVFTSIVVYISAMQIKIKKYKGINEINDVKIIEEKNFAMPYVIVKYYSHILNLRNNISSLILTKTYWYEKEQLNKIIESIKDEKQLNKLVQKIGLISTLILYLLLMLYWSLFDSMDLKLQYLSMVGELKRQFMNIELMFGIDGLALPFILLTGFIMPIVYLSNWTTIDHNISYYVVLIITLEIFLIGVFLVIDLILFYIFFESTLPLLFVLVGLYGALQKFRAGYYLFLYTLLGSLFMLLSFVKMGGDSASSYFECYTDDSSFQVIQQIMWTVLFVSFSVKTPLVPAHIWLPLAHSDANVSGSIILASIVLKLALYGFIRILIGLLLLATVRLWAKFYGFCTCSLFYASLTTMRQFDLKVLVAYSSIAHMASTLLGTFSNTLYGLLGSIIFGLAHGFVSPGLFIIVGAVLYDRCGTRVMNYYKGLTNIMPFSSLIFLILIFGNMGVPLTANFIGEFMSLLGAYQQNIFIASIATTSVILSAIYSINTYNKITSGSLSSYLLTIPDMFRKEYYTLLPLLIITIFLGIYPSAIGYDIEYSLSSYLLILPIFGSSNSNFNKNNDDEIEQNINSNYTEESDIILNNLEENNDNNYVEQNDNSDLEQNTNIDNEQNNELLEPMDIDAEEQSTEELSTSDDDNVSVDSGYESDIEEIFPTIGTIAPNNTPINSTVSSPTINPIKPSSLLDFNKLSDVNNNLIDKSNSKYHDFYLKTEGSLSKLINDSIETKEFYEEINVNNNFKNNYLEYNKIEFEPSLITNLEEIQNYIDIITPLIQWRFYIGLIFYLRLFWKYKFFFWEKIKFKVIIILRKNYII